MADKKLGIGQAPLTSKVGAEHGVVETRPAESIKDCTAALNNLAEKTNDKVVMSCDVSAGLLSLPTGSTQVVATGECRTGGPVGKVADLAAGKMDEPRCGVQTYNVDIEGGQVKSSTAGDKYKFNPRPQ